MWHATSTSIAQGKKYALRSEAQPLSFRTFFELLTGDTGFCDWYSAIIAEFDNDACYWELPPLDSRSIDDDMEFVLIEAPSLARMTPEPDVFAPYFRCCPGDGVVVFPNLGGDATLVVPCPQDDGDSFPHLVAFLRRAGRAQVRALWRITAQTLFGRIGSEPTWLSTAGLGVAWTHVRLDTRPKYYRHLPYKKVGAGD